MCACIMQLSEEVQKKARKELNEIPGEKEDKVKSLREKIAALQEQGKLPKNCRTDNRTLVRFLRANKYDLDKSLNQYNNYQQFRLKVPGLSMEELTYDSVKEVLETGVFEIIDGECKASSCRGIILTPPKWDMRRHKIEQIICAACYMLEVLFDKYEEVEIHGIRLLQDFSNFSFIEQLRMEGALLTAGRPVMQFVQEVFPMRLKGVHLINQPWYVSTLVAIVKPFMKQKMRKRITYHGTNYSDLEVYFNLDVLPPKFGGTEQSTVPLVLQLCKDQ